MKKINVLFMQSQTYFGADSRIHAEIMRYLDRSHFNVHVACNYGTNAQKSPSAQALETIPDLHIRPINFGVSVNYRSKSEIVKDAFTNGLPSLVSLGKLAYYIRMNKIDIIHVTEKPRDAFYGYLLARMTGAKCVVHLHVKAEDWISAKVLWAMKHADALVGVSAFVAQSIIDMGFSREKTYYVLNGMDVDQWDLEIDGSSIRREFNIDKQMPLLIVVSRLFSWKGHIELLKALAKVKEQSINFRLLVVGEDDPRGDKSKGSYSAELKELARTLGLMEQIIFTGYRSDIPQLMAASDMFTMPSFEEPFGMVYLEAMAMNKPVIALDNGGAREVVENGKSGLLSPPKDIDQLARNIQYLIENPEVRLTLGAYGRQQAITYFTSSRMTDDVEQVYRQILGNNEIER